MARSAPVVVLAFAVLASAGAAAPGAWETRARLPVPRTEVAAAAFGSEIAVVGGFNGDGSHSARVDVYSPARDRWRRLPDLPVTAHHAMAVGNAGRLYVLGGYGGDGRPRRTAFLFESGRWRALPRLPFPRAAAGAAVARGRIVVAGGVARVTGARLARNALSFDLRTRRWSVVPGPTAREHLGVTALSGTVYALAGRTSGLDTNVGHFESYSPGDRRWRRLPRVPDARGGTGAAALAGRIVSVGGEEPAGTIEDVYAYRIANRNWERLDDLPTPRHGLGVVAFQGRVFAIAGGPEPGLTVSGANETLRVASSARRYPNSARASAASGLTFRRADGSRIVFRGPTRAWCGAWSDIVGTRSHHVAFVRPDGRGYARPYWHLFAAVRDARPGSTIRFPVHFTWNRPRSAEIFVGDTPTGNEASTEEEDAQGRITFSKVIGKRPRGWPG